MYTFAPNDLNYANCSRCFYLKKKLQIEIKGNFPSIFNAFDLKQKDFYIDKGTRSFTDKLPEGKFFKTITKKERDKRKKDEIPEFNDLEIPGIIQSLELKDNKGRAFFLKGKPDLVVKFKDSYGILDFKTTSDEDKTQSYKFQLEAYAQIFENPHEGPELKPVSHLGLIQFTPDEIFDADFENCKQKMKINYFPLTRNSDEFKKFITEKIDILESNKIPLKYEKCKICNSADKYMEVMNNEK